ncbi:MAG: hypothetical protein MI919_20090, partial [Holophagales bacterium]|nr:hypothetical protein [Holophagales bacterium]
LVARLAAYDWPGNVRQLANVARRLAIARRAGQAAELEATFESLLAADPASDPRPAKPSSSRIDELGEEAPRTEPARGGNERTQLPSQPESPTGRWRPVYRKASDVDEDELVEALRAHAFELTPTAQELGVSRSVLYRLIEQCPRLRKAGDLEREEIEKALESHGDLAEAARSLEVSLQGLRLRRKALGLR